MSRIRVFPNPIDPSEVVHLRSNDAVRVFGEIKKKNDKARIYLQPACQQNDVTPTNAVDLASLQMLAKTHDFDIVCEAGAPAVIIAAVSLVLSVGMAVYSYLNMPQASQLEQGSANNELSKRTNVENIGGRIPDIYGCVNAVPNLVSQPILYYDSDGIEREETLMCIGRGDYLIEDIKDGDTFFSTIPGASTSVYASGQSLIDIPQIQIGDQFTEAPLVGKKSEAITGQTMEQPTESVVHTDVEGTMYPQFPNRIYMSSGGLSAKFSVGESVVVDADDVFNKDETLSGSVNIEQAGVLTIGTMQNVLNPNNFNKIQINALIATDATNGIIDLSGVYDVGYISKSGSYVYEVTLLNPAGTNPNWLLLTEDTESNISSILTDNVESINISGSYPAITGISTSFIELEIPPELQAEWSKLQGKSVAETTIEISRPTDNWQGWFYINFKDVQHLIFNFYFPQGMYVTRTDGGIGGFHANYEIQYQELDAENNPMGEPVSSVHNLDKKSESAFGKSERIDLPETYEFGVRVRARKLANYNVPHKTSRVNQMKIKSVFACSPLEKLVYDNVTMVRALTVATDGALSIKERLWNCKATRKINGEPETRFDRIVEAITVDPFIGRRSASSIDLSSTYNEIVSYFGSSKAAEFNYTFDQSNLSYEETIGQIASMVFCNARRQNNKIYFHFEKENPNSALLFNHRNKKPGSETRTEKYVVDNEYDGVEAKWRDANDKWIESTLKIPNDRIVNPKKLELNGVTNKEQAHLLAHRAWNKIQHQRETVVFSAYGEADLVTLNDRIAVTDDTIPDLVKLGVDGYTSGEVLSQSNRVIEVSQPVQLGGGAVIHLQMANRFVETMSVTQGLDEYHLVLERLPILPLVTSGVVNTVYSITLESNKDIEAYLVSEKSPSSSYESQITAINYDPAYYANDKDIINNLI